MCSLALLEKHEHSNLIFEELIEGLKKDNINIAKLVSTEIIKTSLPPTESNFPFQLASFFLELLFNAGPIIVR